MKNQRSGVFCPLALIPPERFLQGDGTVPRPPVKPEVGSLPQFSTTTIHETFLHPLWLPEDLSAPRLLSGLHAAQSSVHMEAIDTGAFWCGDSTFFQSREIPVRTARPCKLKQIRELRHGLQINGFVGPDRSPALPAYSPSLCSLGPLLQSPQVN